VSRCWAWKKIRTGIKLNSMAKKVIYLATTLSSSLTRLYSFDIDIQLSQILAWMPWYITHQAHQWQPFTWTAEGRHIVMSEWLAVHDHTLKVCEHDLLQTACGNFTKFTTWVQLGTKMNWWDFEVKGSRSGQWQDQMWSKSLVYNFVWPAFFPLCCCKWHHICRSCE